MRQSRGFRASFALDGPRWRWMHYVALALLLVPQSLHAALITVDDSTSTVATNGDCSLREAIGNAEADADTTGGDCVAGSGADTINLTTDISLTIVDNTYRGDNGLPKVSTNITVAGGGFTIERAAAAPAFRIFAVTNTGTLALNNVTVSNGDAAGGGGAIYSYMGSVSLNVSTLSGNDARFGGGIYSRVGSLSMTGSTLSGNSAEYGGGIYKYGGSVSLDDSAISGNSAIEGGGGIWSLSFNYAGSVSLINSTVSGNSAGRQGGGIVSKSDFSSLYEDNLTLTNSTVSGNSAEFGGGIYSDYGTLSLNVSTISGNDATRFQGGGIWRFGVGSVTLTDSTISGNDATREGGGIYSRYADMILTGSTVSANSAEYGGGIFKYDRSMSLTDSTISGNSASKNGGGIWNSGFGAVTLRNSTLSGNSGMNGGGVWNSNSTTLTLENSIVAYSPSGGNCGGPGGIVDGLNNFSDDATCPAGFSAITAGAHFDTTLNDNGGPTLTHALFAGSVAIDAAGACGLATDQRGVLRDDGACDSGSYEYAPPPPVPLSSPWSLALLAVGLLAVLALVFTLRRATP